MWQYEHNSIDSCVLRRSLLATRAIAVNYSSPSGGTDELAMQKTLF